MYYQTLHHLSYFKKVSYFGLFCTFDILQVIVERAEKSDVPDIDKKKYVSFF